jgi:hypothetical protein
MSSISTCMACGEQGHRSSSCKNIALPPEGFYTGGGGGGGHSHDEDDERVTSSATLCRQDDSVDGEIQSRLQMQRVPFRESPNKPSNGLVLKA